MYRNNENKIISLHDIKTVERINNKRRDNFPINKNTLPFLIDEIIVFFRKIFPSDDDFNFKLEQGIEKLIRINLIPKIFRIFEDYCKTYFFTTIKPYLKEYYPEKEKLNNFIEKLYTDDPTFSYYMPTSKRAKIFEQINKHFSNLDINDKKIFLEDLLEYIKILRIPEDKLPINLFVQIINKEKPLPTINDFILFFETIKEKEIISENEILLLKTFHRMFYSHLYNKKDKKIRYKLPIEIEVYLLLNNFNKIKTHIEKYPSLKKDIIFSEESLNLIPEELSKEVRKVCEISSKNYGYILEYSFYLTEIYYDKLNKLDLYLDESKKIPIEIYNYLNFLKILFNDICDIKEDDLKIEKEEKEEKEDEIEEENDELED